MFFRHYQLSLVLPICAIILTRGASIRKTVPHHSSVSDFSSSIRSLKETQQLTDQSDEHFSLLDQLQDLIDIYRTKINDYRDIKYQPLTTTTTHSRL